MCKLPVLLPPLGCLGCSTYITAEDPFADLVYVSIVLDDGA